jgi:flagellar hook assembly protein FlgD
MVVTQHLRDEGPVVSSIHLKERPGPRYRACFRLTRDDTIEVAMVDASDQTVRVLAAPSPTEGGDTPHCYDWDGTDSSGQPVPPGRYHVRVELQEADRTAVSGERIKITTSGTTP